MCSNSNVDCFPTWRCILWVVVQNTITVDVSVLRVRQPHVSDGCIPARMGHNFLEIVFRQVQRQREDLDDIPGECKARLPVSKHILLEVWQMARVLPDKFFALQPLLHVLRNGISGFLLRVILWIVAKAKGLFVVDGLAWRNVCCASLGPTVVEVGILLRDQCLFFSQL